MGLEGAGPGPELEEANDGVSNEYTMMLPARGHVDASLHLHNECLILGYGFRKGRGMSEEEPCSLAQGSPP